ncbi:MAG: hypothetical protein JWN52_7685 [Actinomycetia bacterium]|nr:hypothetical protein [Actinomycetes bacterium]
MLGEALGSPATEPQPELQPEKTRGRPSLVHRLVNCPAPCRPQRLQRRPAKASRRQRTSRPRIRWPVFAGQSHLSGRVQARLAESTGSGSLWEAGRTGSYPHMAACPGWPPEAGSARSGSRGCSMFARQPGPGTATHHHKNTTGHPRQNRECPGQTGCAVRDLNPEPAD